MNYRHKYRWVHRLMAFRLSGLQCNQCFSSLFGWSSSCELHLNKATQMFSFYFKLSVDFTFPPAIVQWYPFGLCCTWPCRPYGAWSCSRSPHSRCRWMPGTSWWQGCTWTSALCRHISRVPREGNTGLWPSSLNKHRIGLCPHLILSHIIIILIV